MRGAALEMLAAGEVVPERSPVIARHLLSILCGFLVGCAGQPVTVIPQTEAPDSSPLGLGQSSLIRFDDDYPSVYLRGYEFREEIRTPAPFLVEQPCDLVFTPLLMEDPSGDVRLETYLVVGETETLLGSMEPKWVVAARLKRRKFDRQVLGRRQVIELSSYVGQQVSLKWVLREARSGQPASVAVALHSPAVVPKKETLRKKPNILFICSDAHRYDYAFGEPGRTLMPQLTQLASRSVVYHQAFANSSWTLPSVVSVLTGLFARFHRTGERIASGSAEELESRGWEPGQFLLNWGENSYILTAYPRQLETLTELLQRHGYYSAMILSNPMLVMSGLYADGQDLVIDTTVVPGERVNRAALHFLRHWQGDQPLFLYVHYMDVHHFHKPLGLWWPWGRKVPRERTAMTARYSQAVRECDRYLGELLEAWNARFGLDESLIVFLADHGEHLLDPGRHVIGHGNTMDECLLHVPLLVKYPVWAGVEPGEVNRPVSLVDLYPTVLDLVGIDYSKDPQERFSLLVPEGGAAGPGRDIFADYQLYGDELSSIRNHPLKLVLSLADGATTMVDLSLPPGQRGEQDQMVRNHPMASVLQEKLDRYIKDAQEKTAGLGSDLRVDPARSLEGLKALGYVQ